jgi:hypothetical protein
LSYLLLYTLAGFEPGSSGLQADAMTTMPEQTAQPFYQFVTLEICKLVNGGVFVCLDVCGQLIFFVRSELLLHFLIISFWSISDSRLVIKSKLHIFCAKKF